MNTELGNEDALSIAAFLEASSAPVTLFSLSWCSYCHAVKQLLKQLKIPFDEVELDTGRYREPALNARLRTELRKLTGSNTLPQVFVGRTSVGGYTETSAAARNGKLQKLLAENPKT